MTVIDTQTIERVVNEVIQRLGTDAAVAQSRPGNGSGLFNDVDQAVDAAAGSQRQLADAGLTVRDEICSTLKQMAADNAQAWGQFEFEETKIGRLDHKIVKLELLKNIPGVEFLRAQAHSGDEGVSLDEAAPWGVIGVITPVTHSIPTMTSNAINMIAAGNAMVVNPHPGGAKSAALAASAYNRAIGQRFGIDPLICVIDPPTLRSAEEIFRHQRIGLLAVTGGPAVARAAMKQPKRAIVAGPGNPPVVVDETADLDNAARSIIEGGGFDNNLLCIGEKQVFVVASVFDGMRQALTSAGAAELDSSAVSRLTDAAFEYKDDHHVVQKSLLGKDPQELGQAAGVTVKPNVDLLFGETAENHPFVSQEQMMPFIPLVRVAGFDDALRLALESEHGFGHTAVIHSNNLDRITRMGRAMNTTIFVANGPSTAALGVRGEGYTSYSIATPTGEGVTTPLTFTRFRRLGISGALRII